MSEKPGILLVCHSYPPVLGGSEIEAQRVASALIRKGYRVRVLCAGGPPMPDLRHWTDPAGVPVSILTRRSKGRLRDIIFALQVGWTMLIRRNEFDLVYFLMQGLHLAAGLPIAAFLGKRVVTKISGDGIFTTMSRSRAGAFELDWLRRYQIPVMVLNDQMAREAEACGFPRSQLTWMPNPVEIDLFRPVSPQESARWREQHGIRLDAKVAVYTGRLSTEKGIRELMRGVAVAMQVEPLSILVLVGDGPVRSELEALAKELDPSGTHFRFVGRVPLADIPNWLGSADVFALTSPNEGFSCSLVEAMAAGIPSVVSNIDANLQLVTDGDQGITVPWNAPAAIGAALAKLFGDAALRRSLGTSARERVVNNYSTDQVIARYELLFDSTLPPRSRPEPGGR